MEHYLDHAPCIYFSAADDGTLVEVNCTLCQQLGYRKEELIGQKLAMLFTVPTRIFQQTHFFPLLKIQGHAEEIYITLLTKTAEEIPLLVNAERKVMGAQPVSVYTGIVVHNRKKFEEELIAAKKAAETALNENTALVQAKQQLQQHMELLDQQVYLVHKQNAELRQFNRVVTHDLQEPLRKLSVFTSMLLENSGHHTDAKMLQKINGMSEQMRSVLSGLQQYVWLTDATVQSTPVDLAKLLQTVRHELEKENAGTAIEIEAETLPVVEADREQLHFLLHEILSNAVRFRKPGHPVHIHMAANILLLNKFKTLSGKYKYTEYVKLEIRDSGMGFDAAYKEQVFELFKKLHPVSGRGIGLSLCKKIVEHHHGTITIDSKKEEGTTVIIHLPVQQKAIPSGENQDKTLKSNSK